MSEKMKIYSNSELRIRNDGLRKIQKAAYKH